MTDHQENQLLVKIANGDREAYATLYTQYTPLVYRFILPFTKNREDAEEVVQDVFLRIWISRERLVAVRSFESYLFRMAKNRLIDLRRKSFNKEFSGEEQPASTDPYSELIFREYHDAALTAIENLPPQRKKVFMLRTVEELQQAEIAQRLGISVSAVKKHLYKATAYIQKYLRQHAGWR